MEVKRSGTMMIAIIGSVLVKAPQDTPPPPPQYYTKNVCTLLKGELPPQNCTKFKEYQSVCEGGGPYSSRMTTWTCTFGPYYKG